jgi:hypothetical protein
MNVSHRITAVARRALPARVLALLPLVLVVLAACGPGQAGPGY